jgi:hypothetical protein
MGTGAAAAAGAGALSAQAEDHEEQTAWDRAVDIAASLSQRLEPGNGAAGQGAGPFEGVAELRQRLNDLERSFAKKEADCLAANEAEDYAEIEALLRSPLLDAARREKLWAAGQKLSLKLLGEMLARDDADNQAGEPPAWCASGKNAVALGAAGKP